MQNIIFNIHSGRPLIMGYAGETNARTAKFEGFEKEKQESAIVINIKGIGSRPLVDFAFPASYTYTKKEGTYEAYLAEIITDSNNKITYERHSNNFDFIIKHSAPLEDEATPSTDTFEDWSAEITGAIADLNARADRGDFDGAPGANGVSPTVSISKNGTVTTITITDANGVHTATINDGQNGQNGTPGANGSDGISPTVSVSKAGKVTTVTITDKNGTHTATINDGEDATLTSQAIIDALTYTPAKQSDLEAIQNKAEGSVTKQLNEDLASKVTEPTTAQVGQIFKVASIDSDGHYVMEAINIPKVKINGTETADNNIPIASDSQLGASMIGGYRGIAINSSGYEYVYNATTSGINGRAVLGGTGFGVISSQNVIDAVNSVVCSDKTSEALTSAQQSKALARLGADGKFEFVTEVITTEEETRISINLGFEASEIIIYYSAKASTEHTSNVNSMFFKCLNGSTVITENAYVANGLGGTSAISAMIKIADMGTHIIQESAKYTSAMVNYSTVRKSSLNINTILLHGNDTRYFGIGSKITVYAKRK